MSELKAINLKCEYEVTPLGVQNAHPLLSWQISADHPVMQKAYKIVASSSQERLENHVFDLLDTGKVETSKSYGIPYNGRTLHSEERVYWAVKIWDSDGKESDFSECSWFETGLFDKKEWKGVWLSFVGGMVGNGLLMRHYFETKEKEIIRARAYVCCVGYYEFHLNGRIIGEKKLDPAPTDYSKTVLYTAYDITSDICKGGNALGFMLGTGFAGLPKILLQINIDYADGERQEVYTEYGTSWCVARGPITYNALYDGEDYDARMEKDGWDTPEYEPTAILEHQRPKGWIMATIVEDPGGERISEIMAPIQVCAVYEPRQVSTFDDGTVLYDVGKNITGWVEIDVVGDAGAKVGLSFAEVLNEEGKLEKTPLRSARCEDYYILRGRPDGEQFEPRFTYHGFQYFTVKTEGNVKIKGLRAKFVHMNLRDSTTFSCDNEILNKIADAMRQTDACNFMGIPTDCAQRDERHGWATDPTSNAEGAVYTFDVAGFFMKWIRDLYDTRNEEGYFADTAPYRWGGRPNDPQANIPVGMLLLLYRMYGNRREMEQHYDEVLEYMNRLLRESENLMISRSPYGEWACPKAECFPEEHGPGATPKFVSFPFVSTTYFYFTLLQMQEMAKILERKEISYLGSLAETVRNKINEKYFDRETAQYDQGTQSANAMAVMMGLAEKEFIPAIVKNIVRNLEDHDYHLTTGSVGTKAVIQTLCENGYEDVVFKIMTKTTSPSFGYMIVNGATTIWERWEADHDNNIMNSRNHPMFAQACVWFYKYLGGINLSCDASGTQKLTLCPLIPGGLNQVSVSMEILSGQIKSEWEKKEEELIITVDIPQNVETEARILKKYGTVSEIQSSIKADSEEAEDYILFKLCAGRHRIVIKR
ncbi:MAG: family 78 glycoside hydrolase catalytic domain [Eubacteriales bacterium]|nr:family 78 glycoside hydrolase catalytic domain [Eubacteriales bacterium]